MFLNYPSKYIKKTSVEIIFHHL